MGRLVRRSLGRRKATVAIHFGDCTQVTFSLSTAGNLKLGKIPEEATPRAIFVPSREALAMYEGFIAAYEQRELSFDETYFDLCKALTGKPLLGPRGKEVAKLVPT